MCPRSAIASREYGHALARSCYLAARLIPTLHHASSLNRARRAERDELWTGCQWKARIISGTVMARGNVSIMRSPGRCASRRDGKNHVFKSYDDLVDHCCTAWNRLIGQPWRIMSIGLLDWLRNDAARPGYGNDLAEFRLGFQKPRYYPVSPKGSRFPAVGEAMTSRTVTGLRPATCSASICRDTSQNNDELNRENLDLLKSAAGRGSCGRWPGTGRR
jgi:hypothetical protein